MIALHIARRYTCHRKSYRQEILKLLHYFHLQNFLGYLAVHQENPTPTHVPSKCIHVHDLLKTENVYQLGSSYLIIVDNYSKGVVIIRSAPRGSHFEWQELCCGPSCGWMWREFYRFPADVSRRNSWVAAINYKNWQPSEYSWLF